MLLLVPLLLYRPVLGGEFVWDDFMLVPQNETLPRADASWRIWAGSQGFCDYYPLTWSLVWLGFRLWGENAAAYHAVCLGLHVASVFVLWGVLERQRLPGAWWAALVFAVHPVNVASVAWVSELKNTLSFVWYGLAVWAWAAWTEEGRARDWGLALACFAAGLLSKTSGVGLPVVFLAWMLARGERRRAWACLPFFVLSLAAGVGSLVTQQERAIGSMPLPVEGLAQKVAAAGANLLFYVSKALVPLRLTSIYPRQEIDAASVAAWIPLGCVGVAGLALAWGAREDERLVPLARGAGWFAWMLVPVLGFIPMSFSVFARVADFWQYLALSGLVAGAVGTFCLVCPSPRVRVAVGWGTVMMLIGLSWGLVGTWTSGLALWSQNVREYPRSWCGHNTLGVLLQESGRGARAIEHFRRALAERPDYPVAQANLAHLQRSRGMVDEACTLLRDAWRRHGDNATVVNELAWLLATTRRTDLRDPREALLLAREACRLTQDRPDPNMQDTLACALAAAGQMDEAIRVARQAQRLALERRDADMARLIRLHLGAFARRVPWYEQ